MTKTKRSPEEAKPSGPEVPTVHSVTELQDMLIQSVKQNFLCVLTGLPGSGKSYLTRLLSRNPKLWLRVEEYGADVRGKYISSPPAERLAEAMIITGTSENMFELVLKAVEIKRPIPLKGVVLFYVFPDFKVFSESNALKAKAETPYSQYFAGNAKLSKGAVQNQAKRQFALWAKKLSAVASSHDLRFESLHVLNTYDGKTQIADWDEQLQRGGKHD